MKSVRTARRLALNHDRALVLAFKPGLRDARAGLLIPNKILTRFEEFQQYVNKGRAALAATASLGSLKPRWRIAIRKGGPFCFLLLTAFLVNYVYEFQ